MKLGNKLQFSKAIHATYASLGNQEHDNNKHRVSSKSVPSRRQIKPSPQPSVLTITPSLFSPHPPILSHRHGHHGIVETASENSSISRFLGGRGANVSVRG